MESQERMSGNDIIKALGYCFAVGDCEHCIYADKPCQELMADALVLINRLKEENETLKAMIEAAEDHYNPLPFKGIFDEKIAEAKAEAFKEFAERLNHRVGKYTEYDEGGWDSTIWAVKIEIINSIMKEMTEGNDA